MVDILVREGHGALVVLKAYFDASTRMASGVFCVAGFAFPKLQLLKFDRDWWALFGKYGGCHMKELTQRRGRFEGIEQVEADRLIKEAVKILRKRAWYGVVVSCNLREIDPLLPKWIQGFEHAYPVCCHMAMTILGSKIGESGRDHEVAYTFETGDEYSGCAHRFMDQATKAPEVKKSYRHSSHTFADKDAALALQGADVLAWEWAKYFDETVGKRIRPMRLSLAHLLLDRRKTGYDDKVYKLAHLTGDSLKRWSEQATELGLTQLAEERVRKANRSSDEAA